MAFISQCLLLAISALAIISQHTTDASTPFLPSGTTPGACFKSWSESANTNTTGGIQKAATNLMACQTTCLLFGDRCTGIDWTPSGSQCFLSGSWTTGRNNGTATGTTHYDVIKVGAGCTAAPVPGRASTMLSTTSFVLTIYLVVVLPLLLATIL